MDPGGVSQEVLPDEEEMEKLGVFQANGNEPRQGQGEKEKDPPAVKGSPDQPPVSR